jgi:hypothetical protein
MTVRRASLDNFDRASVVDPIAHFVAIERSIGNSRREIVEPGMQEWQIHNEVDRKSLTCAGGRQSLTFKHNVCSSHVFPEPIAKHKADIRMFNVAFELD